MLTRLLIVLFLLVAVPTANGTTDTLPATVRSALDVRNVPHDTLSVYVENLETGEVVLSWLDDRPRNPGSTIKLLTTLAALDILGPTYRWQTNVYALGDIKDGRLAGDLLLEGRGDPFLVTERVWQLLRQLRHEGIRDIGGKLLLDDSFFDVPEEDPAEFDRRPLRAYNVAPNALMMNFKVIQDEKSNPYFLSWSRRYYSKVSSVGISSWFISGIILLICYFSLPY